jgi:hypothetical protein
MRILLLYPPVVFKKSRNPENTTDGREPCSRLCLGALPGNPSLSEFTGDILNCEKDLPKTRTRNVVLDGRQDLRLHFLVSDGLNLFSDSQLGFAVGEFK